MKKSNFFNDIVFVSTCVSLLGVGSYLLTSNFYDDNKVITNEKLNNYVATELNLNNQFEMLEDHAVGEAKTFNDETTVKVIAPPIEEKILTDDMESKAYNIGYKNGQYAMYRQMNMQINDENKVEEYTSLENSDEIKSEEEKKKIDEIIQKGYVDGYHRASESFSCPRSY